MSPLRFTFDLDRCTGCQACVLGCWMENRQDQEAPWRRVHTFNPHGHPDLAVFHLSLACHHCAHPACLENCPAGAYTRDEATGAVVLQAQACMGCRYCTWACPHDAPRFRAGTGTVEKCTFCVDRLGRGLEPACVARCPVAALGIEARTGGASPTPPGFHGWALEPGIRFLGQPGAPRIAPGRGEAARSYLAAPGNLAAMVAAPPRKITLRGEWTLVVFTTILAVATARMAAGGPFHHPWPWLAALVLAMLLSALHLGRPGRAWRAVLNVRHSWLSREIVLASAFMALCAGVFAGLAPAWAAAAAGFASLFAVDRVYRVAVKVPPWNLHSAHALLNGLYLAGLLARWWPLAAAAGALKAGLYLVRKGHAARTGEPLRPLLSLIRLALGFGVPALAPPVWAVLGALAGDLVDRCEYYCELEIPTPAAGMNEAMLGSAYKY